jgi:hypothetical protein
MGRFMRRIHLLFLCLALLGTSNSIGQTLTTVKVKNLTAGAKADAVLTFGMVFRKGDVPAGKSVSISGANYQVDAKATHADGSLRHAVVSLALGNMPANETKSLPFSAAAPQAAGVPIDAADVLKSGFDAKVNVTLGGLVFSASARDYLAAAPKWLSGPVCTEWLITAPLKTLAGIAHPHLHARFAVRAYQGLKSIRADVTVENDWAFEPLPMGYTYDVAVIVGASQAYAKTGLAHTHHARWRKVFWWGADPALEYEYDRDYLFSTGAFPFFDRTVQVAGSAISALKEDFDPMANGGLESYMPGTGAHNDIGPLPNFAAIYLLTQDPKARRNVLANGACGGSFQIHYRNKASDMPVSLDDFPYMTLLGSESNTMNPKTGKLEAFPAVANPLSVHDPDDAHQPSIAFLPYAISGDYFQLEELQFWANWNMILANPEYRQREKGLLAWGQNRAQGWGMRTLGQAAYITPDSHPLKKYFNDKVNNNIVNYIAKYPQNAAANPFGHLEGHYPYPPYGMAPWMDDFFTWSMGYLYKLGFTQVLPLAQWKAKFVVGRMTEAGYCWLQAGIYELQVGVDANKPYKTWAELYKANYPNGACTGLKMDGYPDVATGYGANMQPALAAAVDVNAPGAKAAWEKYTTRNPKQDYSSLPEFAVVPDPGGASGIGARKPNVAGKGATGAPTWFMPGSKVSYRLDFASDVFVDIYDTSGRKVVSVAAGKQAKGPHTLDPLRDLAGANALGKTPYLLEIRAVDGFRHSEYLKVSPAQP